MNWHKSDDFKRRENIFTDLKVISPISSVCILCPPSLQCMEILVLPRMLEKNVKRRVFLEQTKNQKQACNIISFRDQFREKTIAFCTHWSLFRLNIIYLREVVTLCALASLKSVVDADLVQRKITVFVVGVQQISAERQVDLCIRNWKKRRKWVLERKPLCRAQCWGKMYMFGLQRSNS